MPADCAGMFGGIYAILGELESCRAVKPSELELMELGVELAEGNAAMTRDCADRFVKQVRPLLLLGDVRVSNDLLCVISGGMCPVTIVESKITPEASARIHAQLLLIDRSITP